MAITAAGDADVELKAHIETTAMHSSARTALTERNGCDHEQTLNKSVSKSVD